MTTKVVIAILSTLYPTIIFFGLYFGKLSPRILSLALITLALFHLSSYSKQNKGNAWRGLFLFIATALCGSAAFTLNSFLFLKFYPVIVNVAFLVFFTYTLHHKPSLAFRMASLDKKILKSPSKNFIESYCNKVTFAWCIFFTTNALLALVTIISQSDFAWIIYNGLIAYILMGIFFMTEITIRKKIQHNVHEYIPFSSIQKNSRPDESIVAFDGNFEKGSNKSWKDFTNDIARLRAEIKKHPEKIWILHCEDAYFFCIAMFAILQCGREVRVSANAQSEFIKEIHSDNSIILADIQIDNAMFLPDILEKQECDDDWTPFDPKHAKITLYTSGSTGKPSEITKPFILMENETEVIATEWKKNFENRIFCSTVNHMHIYGMLWQLFVPLSIGLPFTRRRQETPSELHAFEKQNIVLISSPAFLKRLAASDENFSYETKPFVMSSGGVLPPEIAEATEKKLDYWPMEVYGSTETGGIAYHQSKNGLEWTPFHVCQISLTEESLLHVKSTYIENPDGFTQGDICELLPNGHIILKGRADSIVKIEEKRISLPEVENRIRQTGFVADARVIPITGKRQFLAAAIVLNSLGKEKFKNLQKLAINNFFKEHLSLYLEPTVLPKKWRYVEELPQDILGKIKTRDVQLLFNKPDNPNCHLLTFAKNLNKVTVKLLIPENSDYYNGHFEVFKLLPAVVQIELVMRFANQLLGTTMKLQKILRTKFTKPIFPDTPFFIDIEYLNEKNRIVFTAKNEHGENLSNGSILLEEAKQ